MRYELVIDTDNDAFQPDPQEEIARILQAVVNALKRGVEVGLHDPYNLRDINGNVVGSVSSH